jgi:hypothetical protein
LRDAGRGGHGGMRLPGRDLQQTQVLCGFTIKLLFFIVKARKNLYFLIKHRDLNAIGSDTNCEAESFAFEISEHFLLRIDPAVVHNFSATPQSPSGKSPDWKVKIVKDDNLRVADGQHGANHAEGVVICKIRGISADSREYFCFFSQTPGNSCISCSASEISMVK